MFDNCEDNGVGKNWVSFLAAKIDDFLHIAPWHCAVKIQGTTNHRHKKTVYLSHNDTRLVWISRVFWLLPVLDLVQNLHSAPYIAQEEKLNYVSFWTRKKDRNDNEQNIFCRKLLAIVSAAQYVDFCLRAKTACKFVDQLATQLLRTVCRLSNEKLHAGVQGKIKFSLVEWIVIFTNLEPVLL